MKDGGVLYICELLNLADNGQMPVQTLVQKQRFWFENRVIGLSRQYQAKGVNEQVDMVVRIPFDTNVRIGEYAVLGNGHQFRIDNVTPIFDDEALKLTELTLSRLNKNYDVRCL